MHLHDELRERERTALGRAPGGSRIAPERRARAWIARAACAALALAGTALGVDAWLPPGPGEPLLLRWTRTAAEHPLRTALAGALAALALAPLGAPGTLDGRAPVSGTGSEPLRKRQEHEPKIRPYKD